MADEGKVKPEGAAAAGGSTMLPPPQSPIRRPSFDPKLPSKPVYRIVITGGPCAGKTTSMARITDFLRARGFRVFVVPEAATMLWKGGATPDDLAEKENRILFQRKLINLQMTLEESFADMAYMSSEPVVIMCDRGCMDGSAYMDSEEWEIMLQRIQKSELELRDTRYNAVIHLVTAALGAEKHYSKTSNETRYEPPEGARAVDVRLQKAWTGHPKQYVIDNRSNFEEKLSRVVDVVAQLVGLPSTFRRCRKFVLDLSDADIADLPSKCQTAKEFSVEKTYLAPTGTGPNGTHFVRRRWSPAAPNLVAFGLTSQLKSLEGDGMEETKQIITEHLYNHLVINHRDPKRLVVKQSRWCCMWEDEDKVQQYFEIHKYVGRPLDLLYVQLSDSATVGKVPPFLKVKEEVTGQKNFSANELSLNLEVAAAI
eukprot:m.435474 g.435474  ORF g.435474 m.435474 type:complete len:426 (+) comp17852_c0_seq1:101-1378(+)